MANGQVFSLADTYGRGIEDTQREEFVAERNKAMKSQNQTADILKSTAQQAVDPQSGEYSPVAHARALEQQGYPGAAQEIRTKALEGAERGYQFLQHSLPFINAQTWPAVKQKAEQGGLVPAGTLPDQYDPAFVQQLEQRLVGQLTELYGDLEQVASGPGGAAIYGQREQSSGKLANVTTVRPPGPTHGPAPARAPSGYRFTDDRSALEPIPGGPHAPEPAQPQPAAAPAAPAAGGPVEFASEQDVGAALQAGQIAKGDVIVVNGRRFRID